MTVWPRLVVILSAVIALALSQHGKDLTLMDKDTFQGSVKFPLSSQRQSEVNSRTAIGSRDGVFLSGAQHKCAGDDVYSCSSGDVICHTQVCDGVADCPDWDDESNCECDEGTFLCDGALCVDNSQMCDGVLDCADGTDEECGGANPNITIATVATTTTTTTMPSCLNDAAPRLCQDGTTYACFCDGVVDCPNREDEHHCKPDVRGRVGVPVMVIILLIMILAVIWAVRHRHTCRRR